MGDIPEIASDWVGGDVGDQQVLFLALFECALVEESDLGIGLLHLFDLFQSGGVAAAYTFQFHRTLPQILPAECLPHSLLVEGVIKWSELCVLREEVLYLVVDVL